MQVPKKQMITAKEREKLEREVDVMSKINHPNVCLFMGACLEPEIIIVSELLEGDIEHLLKTNNSRYSVVQRVKVWSNEKVVLHRLLWKPPLLFFAPWRSVYVHAQSSQLQRSGRKTRRVAWRGCTATTHRCCIAT